MSELHFHSIQDYKITVNGIEIKPVSEETRSFEVIGGEELGLLDGLNVSEAAWEPPNVFSKAADRVIARMVQEGVLKYDSLPLLDELKLEQTEDGLKVVGRTINPIMQYWINLQVKMTRKRRANFKPHMRRRLKAVRR